MSNKGNGGAVLITGGAGFIGSHVARQMIERGWHVVVLDDLSMGKPENAWEIALKPTAHRARAIRIIVL